MFCSLIKSLCFVIILAKMENFELLSDISTVPCYLSCNGRLAATVSMVHIVPLMNICTVSGQCRHEDHRLVHYGKVTVLCLAVVLEQ